MIQVCARCLSIPVEKVFLCDTASDNIANASPTAASVSSDLYGGAVQVIYSMIGCVFLSFMLLKCQCETND